MHKVHRNRQTLIEKNHKQYLPDTIYKNNIPKSTEINSWHPQICPCDKENYI